MVASLRSTLRVRLMLLVLIAILPVFGLTLYGDLEQRRQAIADIQHKAERALQLTVTKQGELIHSTRQLLMLLAQLPQVRERDARACHAVLSRLLTPDSRFANLRVSTLDGEVFCSARLMTEPVNVADARYFQSVLTTHDFAIGNFEVGPISQKPMVGFGYPVLDETGQVQAVVVATLDLAWLNRLLMESDLPPHSTLTLFDRQGIVLARYPESASAVGQSTADLPIVKTILSQPSGTAQGLAPDGTPHLSFFRPLQDNPDATLYLNLDVSEADALADIQDTFARHLAVLGVVTAIAMAAAWFGGEVFVRRPLQLLTGTARRWASGDLSTRTGLVNGWGEFGELAHTFDEMARALEQREAEHARAVQALRESDDRYRDLFENANDLIQCVTPAGSLVYTNRAWRETLGYTEDEVAHLSLVDIIDPDCQDHCLQVFGRLMAGEKIERIEAGFVSKGGQKITVEGSINCRFDHGQPVATRGIFRDITARKQAEQQLVYVSTHDSLTGLYNRGYFVEAQRRLQRANDFPASIIMLDVDNLKNTNDRLGHAVGDEVLKQAAALLTASFRAQDIIARIGGDEFAVLLPATDAPVAEAVAQRLRHNLCLHNDSGGGHRLSLSLGVATAQQRAELPQVYSLADERMYQDKAAQPRHIRQRDLRPIEDDNETERT
ncbi:MAG: diguanylate cyclase [Chloroflexi bacterium]|nr:diguanylate cyclase [Chloroflexota bacterium]